MRRILICLCLALASCSPGPDSQIPVAADAPADFPEDPFQGQKGIRFTVIPSESIFQLRVFRGGKLARLGHNHVISSRGLGGELLLSEPVSASRASLYLSLASLVVDDPDLRQAAGEGFEYPLSRSDRDATRSNMMGERLLDAGRFRYVRVQVLQLAGSPQAMQADLEIEIQGRKLLRSVPLELNIAPCEVLVKAQFGLTHSELGLAPFSALAGALLVQDAMELALELKARSREKGCAARTG
jgi:hypothetical protein